MVAAAAEAAGMVVAVAVAVAGKVSQGPQPDINASRSGVVIHHSVKSSDTDDSIGWLADAPSGNADSDTVPGDSGDSDAGVGGGGKLRHDKPPSQGDFVFLD